MPSKPSLYPNITSLQGPQSQNTRIATLRPQNPKIPLVKYGVFERIFRTTVFQFAVFSVGWLERFLFYIYRCFAKTTCYPEPFADERMDRSLDIFIKLGGKEKYIIPEDGNAEIHMITMKSSDLEAIIEKKGGKWIKERNEFQIIPPENINDDWLEFQNKYLLNKTGWFLAARNNKQVIITCEHADLVDEQKICFYHIHNPFIRERFRAGFYLGMKKDCAFYDPSGVRLSKGNPSEKRSYLDAEAVFHQLLREGYVPNQIYVSGPCRSSAIAAYLKKKYHDEGINFISESGFISLEEDMINSQCWLVRALARWNLTALKSRDIPKSIGPEEDYFNTKKKWEALSNSDKGKVIIIHAENDQTLPKGIEDRFVALAKKVNQQVYKLYFKSADGTNGHNELCLKDPSLRKRFIEVIFDKASAN